MTPIEYYQQQFPADLGVVIGGRPTRGERLSVLTFTASPTVGTIGAAQLRFQSFDTSVRVRFLFCLHFSVLIDQAIHEGARAIHPDFDRIAGYPKLAGILASYWSNLHPALLLRAATLHVEAGADSASEDLASYAQFFPADYRRFILDDFPNHTQQLPDLPSRERLLSDVMSSARAAYSLFGAPSVRSGFFPFSGGTLPNEALYTEWLGVVRRGLA